MKIQTRLGQNRHHWMEGDLAPHDRAALLVEIVAPPLPRVERAAATSLVVVLDRSGSMSGDRLDHAKRALCEVVDQLSSGDTFGLITFDDQVDVAVPAGPVADRESLKSMIRAIRPGGTTNLAAGFVRGLQEAQRLENPAGVRVLLISDGHANVGVTDPAVLGAKAGGLVERRITTSTLGMGLGYDERILSAVARLGGGNEHFAEEADAAAGAIGVECGELLGQRFLSCRLTIVPSNSMADMQLLNEATVQPAGAGLTIDLGGFAAEQVRSLVFRFTPKLATRPGRRKVAVLRLDYTLADDLSDHSVSTSVWAHVGSAGDAIPVTVDRGVMAEVLFQRVQRRKRRATEALALGDLDEAQRVFRSIRALVKRHWSEIPLERRREFEAELAEVGDHHRVLDMALPDSIDLSRMSKALSAGSFRASRRRGRA